VGDYLELARTLDVPAGAYLVIVTHQHTGDEAVLRELLRRDLAPRYVGLVGSRTKLVDLYRRLLADGIPRDRLAAVHAPIGVDLGGQRAEEIALAIAAELVAARYGKTLADSLRDRARVIDKL
jgi:xanthine dehydrogenase accessory factor